MKKYSRLSSAAFVIGAILVNATSTEWLQLQLNELENVFMKHYAPNHMPGPKGEWNLKENNLELHHGIYSKVNQFIYTLVCAICQISGSKPKRFFRYFVHKVGPIQNACVRKTGVTQPKIYRMC